MTVLLYFGLLVAIVWIATEYYPRWKFRMRHPMVCSEFPAGELRVGDIVTVKKKEYRYIGFDNSYRHEHIFSDGIHDFVFTIEFLRKNASCIRCNYGIKWTLESFRLS